jgi:hypothetical protein
VVVIRFGIPPTTANKGDLMVRQDIKVMQLRLPPDVKTWLEKTAKRTLSSQNNEIVRIIRARMDAQQPESVAG